MVVNALERTQPKSNKKRSKTKQMVLKQNDHNT